ncbi:nucleotidyltransferase family protein [Agrobacterium salinitolerans]|uniref:nucleotidyltransferase family protein n=1 Tax=Agrobacterium salinitolerans TaxID=1183413 RepID=UPI001573A15F|nr:nucleotidyltransferase family protein [Agrobacterium salinitolerans]NTA40075.1 nucleotidyltransferase family protein [Agrobacterium salinitolerans]
MEGMAEPPERDCEKEGRSPANVAAVILAAGKASRMGNGGGHKLLAEFDGEPLVRRVAKTALAANVQSVIVVTGHRREDIEATLLGLEVTSIHNPDYASGMASSLIAGYSAATARDIDGVIVMLADMPGVTAGDLDALIAAFRLAFAKAVVRAVSRGQRGNPVVLPRSLHGAIMRLEGDVGARQLIETPGVTVIDLDIGDAACLDVDTPEDVLAAGGVLER